ncbi:MAG: hypothetical protein KAS07_02120 [Candidatus Pacebacteria bacterium]|nr:hypothetical protein [Candidatus Paceibacterota bacterium]
MHILYYRDNFWKVIVWALLFSSSLFIAVFGDGTEWLIVITALLSAPFLVAFFRYAEQTGNEETMIGMNSISLLKKFRRKTLHSNKSLSVLLKNGVCRLKTTRPITIKQGKSVYVVRTVDKDIWVSSFFDTETEIEISPLQDYPLPTVEVKY